MMDLNQLYTVLFCLWFLALGAIEYLVAQRRRGQQQTGEQSQEQDPGGGEERFQRMFHVMNYFRLINMGIKGRP
jgi:hypothetical protein